MTTQTELAATVAEVTAALNNVAAEAVPEVQSVPKRGAKKATAAQVAAAADLELALIEVDIVEAPQVKPAKKLTAVQREKARSQAKLEALEKKLAEKLAAEKQKLADKLAATKKAAADKKAAAKEAAKAARPAPKAALVFESIEASLEPLAAAIAPLDHDKGKIVATVAGRKVELRWTRPEIDGENYGATICRLNVREFTGEEGAAIGLNGKIKSGSYVHADRAGLLSGLRSGFHKNAERLAAQGRTELAKELDALVA